MSAPNVTVSGVLEFFKRVYPDRALPNLMTKNKPWLSRVKKVDDLTGEGIFIPINAELPTGAAYSADASLANVQANRKSSKGIKVFLQRKKFYDSVSIDGESVWASREKMGAFLNMKTKELEEKLEYMGQRVASVLWQEFVGTVSANPVNVAGAVYTFQLVNIRDAVRIHRGQVLHAYSATTAGTLRNGEGTVTKVNHQTGVVTATYVAGSTGGANPTGAGGWSNNGAETSFIYVKGDYSVQPTSISSWIPASQAGLAAENFLSAGVGARDTYPNAYAGWTGGWKNTIEESVKDLAANMAQYIDPLTAEVWLSPYNFFRLEAEMGTRLQRDQGGTAIAGFSSVRIPTAAGTLPVMVDPFIPDSFGAIHDMSTWELHHLGPFIHRITDDGKEGQRETDYDATEYRFRSWHELACGKPIRNGRFTIS